MSAHMMECAHFPRGGGGLFGGFEMIFARQANRATITIMQIDPSIQAKADNYKMLTNLVVPRPIAWVTSVSQAGVITLAQFSFFNGVGSNPLYVIISVGFRED